MPVQSVAPSCRRAPCVRSSALIAYFLISVRPRKTVRGRQGVVPPAARPGRRPGKKPLPTRRSRPKPPPVDDAEVDELVRILSRWPSSISGWHPRVQHQDFIRRQLGASPTAPSSVTLETEAAHGRAHGQRRQRALWAQLCPASPATVCLGSASSQAACVSLRIFK